MSLYSQVGLVDFVRKGYRRLRSHVTFIVLPASDVYVAETIFRKKEGRQWVLIA